MHSPTRSVTYDCLNPREVVRLIVGQNGAQSAAAAAATLRYERRVRAHRCAVYTDYPTIEIRVT